MSGQGQALNPGAPVALRGVRAFEAATACIVGPAVAWAAGSRLVPLPRGTARDYTALLALALGVAVLAAVGVLRPLRGRVNRLPRRLWTALVGGAVACGIALVPVIPLDLAAHRLDIVVTGRKNPKASGAEVWILGVHRGDGRRVPAASLSRHGAWEIRGRVPLSDGRERAHLRWQGLTSAGAYVRLLSHPWSGIARVAWDGQARSVDLYSERSEERVLRLADFAAAAPLAGVLLWAADAACLAFAIVALAAWLVTRAPARTPVGSARWIAPVAAVAALGVWSAYLLAFWPGLMSSDSTDQWGQVLSGQFQNYHPAFHTLSMWLISCIWASPAAVVAVQIALLALVFGVTLRELEAWYVAPTVRVVVAAAFILSFVNGTMVVTVWKDVAYAIASFAAFTILLRLVRTDGRWIESSWHLGLAWLTLVCLSLYRHNGVLVAAALAGALPWSWPGRPRRRLALVAIAWLLSWLVIVGPLYRYIGVVPIPPVIRLQYMLQQIAAIVHDSARLTDEQREVVASVLPVETWRRSYDCYSVDPIVHWAKIDRQYVDEHADRVLAVWRSLAREHVPLLLRHQVCASSLVWRIRQPEDGYLNVAPVRADSSPSSRCRWLADRFRRLFVWSRKPHHVWWTWRPALYLYLTVFCCALAAARLRAWRVLLVTAPAILNSVVWLLFLMAQDFRYQYPVYLIGLIAPALVFADLPRRDPREPP